MNDLRWAWRSLARSKGFAAIAVLSLALALGLTTTAYSVIDAFTHPFIPFRDPDRLVKVGLGTGWPGAPTASDLYRLIRDNSPFAQEVAASTPGERGLATLGNDGAQVYSSRITPNFFSLLGVAAEHGRVLRADDDPSVAVISHSLWTGLLGQRKDLDRVPLVLDSVPITVVGVMPPEMSYPARIDVWQMSLRDGDPMPPVYPVARLNPDRTIDEALAGMTALAKGMTARTEPRRNYAGHAASLTPNRYQLRRFHWALAGCAFTVLLIACATLANLMLARGMARRSELALRLAIGASRRVLVKQLLTESALVAVGGGILGIMLSSWGVGLASSFPQVEFLPLRPISMSWRILLFGVVTTGVTILLIGLIPALRASNVDVAGPIKESGPTTTGRRRRYSALVVTQMSLALVLLMVGAVLARAAHEYANENLGYMFDASTLYSAHVDLRPQNLDDAAVATRFRGLRERLLEVPGARAVTTYSTRVTPAHTAISDDERNDSVPRILLRSFNEVTYEYFRTLSIPIGEGRDFEPGDREVAIISTGAAVGLWPYRSAIGRMIKLGPPRSSAPWIRVVGVTGRSGEAGENPKLAAGAEVFLVPRADTARNRFVLIRSDGSNPRIEIALAREIQVSAALARPPLMSPALSYHRRASRVQYLTSSVFGFLGACGLGLAAIGLYGVLAYSVTLRTREFGVRMALGAAHADVFKLVLHDGMVMFLAGTALGAFGAIATAQFLHDRLLAELRIWDRDFTDVGLLVLCEGVLIVTALVACLGPARRAMRTDPVEMLRSS